MFMPCICEFDGIQIYMYVPDHNPPHFHVRARGVQAQIDMITFEVLRGELNLPDQRKVLEWARKRQPELKRNWERIEAHLPPEEIQP